MSGEEKDGNGEYIELPKHIVTPTLTARLTVPVICFLMFIFVFLTQWKPGSGTFKLVLSDSGIKVRYTERAPSVIEDYLWLAEEELISENEPIIRGKIFNIRNIEIDWGGGTKSYRAIVGVEVIKPIRGELKEGDTISVLLSVPVTEGGGNIVSRLKEEAEVILLPRRLNEEYIEEHNGKDLYLMEFSGFELLDGDRYVFIGTEGGIEYAVFAYPSLTYAKTLEDVEMFLLEKIETR